MKLDDLEQFFCFPILTDLHEIEEYHAWVIPSHVKEERAKQIISKWPNDEFCTISIKPLYYKGLKLY